MSGTNKMLSFFYSFMKSLGELFTQRFAENPIRIRLVIQKYAQFCPVESNKI